MSCWTTRWAFSFRFSSSIYMRVNLIVFPWLVEARTVLLSDERHQPANKKSTKSTFYLRHNFAINIAQPIAPSMGIAKLQCGCGSVKNFQSTFPRYRHTMAAKNPFPSCDWNQTFIFHAIDLHFSLLFFFCFKSICRRNVRACKFPSLNIQIDRCD